MLSHAVYDAYDAHHAAAWSHMIGTMLLRQELGFRGVTITDSLDAAAQSRGIPLADVAIQAVGAGTDMILLTGSELSSQSVYASLLRAGKAGRLRERRLLVSYERILALKAGR